ncbi:hypothetical protein I7I50_09478 [Histoplasma capsulatum G186AR]|uniref:Uncharacterized protein n=1 Tax=Ajellomyces capsulatus TaxID=5037 RepID=A0A8H7YVI9_AJECA|nr:hypothetical protein I7I52_06999 [Histoplasma capsulatum]QSS74351.1 hypothetical protein I7I50_09478 [Histoplasma capsulatum G186AR]
MQWVVGGLTALSQDHVRISLPSFVSSGIDGRSSTGVCHCYYSQFLFGRKYHPTSRANIGCLGPIANGHL